MQHNLSRIKNKERRLTWNRCGAGGIWSPEAKKTKEGGERHEARIVWAGRGKPTTSYLGLYTDQRGGWAAGSSYYKKSPLV